MMTKSRIARSTHGTETLLSLVGNVVGVVLIVALVLAARARSSPTPPPDDVPSDEIAQLDDRRAKAGALEAEIEKLQHDARGVMDLSKDHAAKRQMLAEAVAAAAKQLADRRAALDGETRSQFDLAHQLATARAQLAALDAAEQDAKNKPRRVVQVQNFPTPIGRTVSGQELHFQLRGGLICYVPLEELMHKLGLVIRERLYRLEGQDQMEDTIGPMDGFNLRYSVERHGNHIVPTRFEFLPVSETQGETVDQALSPSSMFHDRVADLRPEDWTVTLWVYPDSFELFRAVRQDLYRLGFLTAGRPLPDGIPIVASPGGSRSEAE